MTSETAGSPNSAIAFAFWPDHYAQCRCGSAVVLRDAQTSGWTEVRQPDQSNHTVQVIKAVCPECSAAVDRAVAKVTRVHDGAS